MTHLYDRETGVSITSEPKIEKRVTTDSYEKLGCTRQYGITMHTIINKQILQGKEFPRLMQRLRLAMLVGLCTVLAFNFVTLKPCAAKTFTVNTIEDLADLNPGDGLCVAYLTISPPFVMPFCTLRAAIQESNLSAETDTIYLGSRTYMLAVEGREEEAADQGDLDIYGSVNILGKGMNTTRIQANGIDRIFDIHDQEAEVRIANLQVTGGLTQGDDQGRVDGAAIYNSGNLYLNRVHLIDNTGEGLAGGGGIYNQGKCYIDESIIEKNTSSLGGGIHNGSHGYIQLDSTIIFHNHAHDGGGAYNAGTMELLNTTLSTNYSDQGGMVTNDGKIDCYQSTLFLESSMDFLAVVVNNGIFSLTNTIIYGNSVPLCKGTFLDSTGHNLLGDGSCFPSNSPGSDILGINPMLQPLNLYGGITPSHGLLYSSPAVNSGRDLSSLNIYDDQRGIARPTGTGYDIGSFEATVNVAPFFHVLLKSR